MNKRYKRNGKAIGYYEHKQQTKPRSPKETVYEKPEPSVEMFPISNKAWWSR